MVTTKGYIVSKTHKTRPLDVRMLDPKDIAAGIAESHNHEKGYCDLPERNHKAIEERHKLIMADEYPVSSRDRCSFNFAYKGVNICGCPLCTAKFARREERRKIRHESKKVLGTTRKMAQTILEEHQDDLDDAFDTTLDVTIPAHMEVSYF
jgi:hypothetical protein